MTILDSQDSQEFLLSDVERKRIPILVVDADNNNRQIFKKQLRGFGFSTISDAANHHGLEKFNDRRFTHVIFDARATTMSAREFVVKVLQFAPELVLIPTSYEPDIDNVFELILAGSKGPLRKPFTAHAL